ncbi:hypothetical protein DSO57_1005602 [Entomophthora muscae]|uniref:Uncharacterized protein n=1 Tax=Entomophthora muscae TaxID=34485 RepID=A0ACC2RMN5_9FUNG|nr:hypothetical protein DSO57_1005602 [Entomophthora muscae]
MELQRGGYLITVSSIGASRVCDQCKASHHKCNRAVPTCSHCLSIGGKCTRSRPIFDKRINNKLLRGGWKLTMKKSAPSTWQQVVETYSVSPLIRFYLRRFVMPLVLLLPKPKLANEILQLSTQLTQPHYSFKKMSLQIQYSALQIQDTFNAATKAFFHFFNPFCPLFSEEAFLSLPRSPTLRRLVIQIGLERMPQTDLTSAAMTALNITTDDILHLPNSLDSLQCLLLVNIGVRLPSIQKIQFGIFFMRDLLIPLLGLHVNQPSSPYWLERTLALHMTSVGAYHESIGQYTRWTKMIWFKSSDIHLNPKFLPEKTNRNHFPHMSDRIHFIASQAIYHSFTIVAALAKEHERALEKRTTGLAFANTVYKHLNLLKENFMWGWSNLSHLATIAGHKTLLIQSRINLTLRYNNDCLEILKMAFHIPEPPSDPISHTPIIRTTSDFFQRGLNIAFSSIRLISTITPAPFGLDYIPALIPSLAFILTHYKSFKANFGTVDRLRDELSKTIGLLKRGLHKPFFHARAKSYLGILDSFTKTHNIPTTQ